MKKFISVVTAFAITSLGAYQINLKQGWQLLGALEDINVTKVFNNSNINAVWYYSDGKWYTYLPNNSTLMQNLPENIGKLSFLHKGVGFWVNSLSDLYINIANMPDKNNTIINDDNVGYNNFGDNKFNDNNTSFTCTYHCISICESNGKCTEKCDDNCSNANTDDFNVTSSSSETYYENNLTSDNNLTDNQESNLSTQKTYVDNKIKGKTWQDLFDEGYTINIKPYFHLNKNGITTNEEWFNDHFGIEGYTINGNKLTIKIENKSNGEIEYANYYLDSNTSKITFSLN